MAHSDIIFAPYNYVVDPGIRSAMGIDLESSALMIDEAHNILQAAREAASIDMNLAEVKENAFKFSDFVKHIKRLSRKKMVDFPVSFLLFDYVASCRSLFKC